MVDRIHALMDLLIKCSVIEGGSKKSDLPKLDKLIARTLKDELLQFLMSQSNLDNILQNLSQKEADLEILVSVLGTCYPREDNPDLVMQKSKLEFLYRTVYNQRAFVVEASLNAIYDAMHNKNGICLQSFLANFLLMIKGIMNFANLTTNDIAKLLSYLKLTMRKLKRLKPSDMNWFEIESLESLSKLRSKRKTEKNDHVEHTDFRLLSVVPKQSDVFKKSHARLQSNIVHGPYESVEQYLGIHFRLMREDMLESFRSNLVLLSQNFPMAEDAERLHTNVQVSYPPEFTIDGALYTLVLRSLPAHWDMKKCLQPGLLICLSCDKFINIIFATIKYKMINFSEEAQIKVTLENIGEELFYKKPYALFQTDVHFESYRHILQRMKDLNQDQFPLADCIVHLNFLDVKTNVFPDGVLCLHEKCNTSNKKKRAGLKCHCKRFDPLGVWPLPDELNLDGSQLAALRLALQNKMALIQGPPGTGKTYVAVKIVKALLENGFKTPIMICCNTNHALDQFLVQLLKYTQKLVRIGSQGQREELQPYTLFIMWDALKCRFGFNVSNYTIELQKKALRAVKSMCPEVLSKPTKFTFTEKQESFNILCSEINDLHENYANCKYFYFKEEVLNKILDPQYRMKLLQCFGCESKFLSACTVEWLMLPNGNSECYEQCTKMFKELKKRIKKNAEFEATTKHSDFQALSKSANPPAQKNETDSQGTITITEQVENMDLNIWTIPPDVRMDLFYRWRKQELKKLRKLIKEKKNLYFKTIDTSPKLVYKDMEKILKNADIVGMTTCGAAKFKNLLTGVNPKVLVMEEAAEILESHVIASLCPSIEHVILLGDHEQLRPKVGWREFATKCKMNISMFERLLNNGAPSVTLTTQRRMRSIVANLLVPEIYKDLRTHPSVNKYENVTGVACNVFFLQHDKEEESKLSLKIITNDFEAKFVATFCEYLLAQGYDQSRITILSTYHGQVSLILSYITFMIDGLRVTTVDNYQGEENDIILLSFVRSNQQGQIGFLGKSNRICVALSRAKIGFFCVGNFEMLAKSNKIWSSVVEKLLSENALGEKLPLKCRYHDSVIQYISNAEEIKHLITGCGLNCNYLLPCNHKCPRACHYDNSTHEEQKCEELCEKSFKVDGKVVMCRKRCWQPCHTDEKVVTLQCQHTVKISAKTDIKKFIKTYKCQKETKKLLPCGHFCNLPCNVKPKVYPCPAIQHVNLRCGHRNSVRCYQIPDEVNTIQCKGIVIKTSPCGHNVAVPCYLQDDYDSLKDHCRIICDELLTCGHPCTGMCRSCRKLNIHEMCVEKCDLKLRCGHRCEDCCGIECPPCSKPCEIRCSHSRCPNPCFRPCVVCREPCDRSCKHKTCDKMCGEVCDPCNEPCDYILKCGHPCTGFCREPCPSLCRICNTNQLDSGQPDTDRFVMLEQCNHVVEVSKLKSSIKNSIAAQQWPVCPLCLTAIWKNAHFDSELKFAKLDLSHTFVEGVEISTVKALLFSIFPPSTDVKWKFLNIYKRITHIFDNQRHTSRSLNIFKSCLAALKDLIEIEKSLGEEFAELEDYLSWIGNHLQRVSLQQLDELQIAVKNMSKKILNQETRS